MRKAILLLFILVSFVSSFAVSARGDGPAFVVYGSAEGPDYLLYARVNEPGAESLLFFDLKDGAQYRAVHLWESRFYLEEYAGGKRRILGDADAPAGGPFRLVVKHHADYVAVAAAGKVVITARISGSPGKSFGVASAGKALVFRRYQPQEDVYFTDSFMRTDDTGEWDVVRGYWEIVGLSFAERSANPFSLFCRFADSEKLGMLEEGRLLKERVGIGVNISPQGRIVRISGGAPAAEAGLQQDDVILSVNGKSIFLMWRKLEHAKPGEEFRLKVQRGRRIFSVTVKARRYRWGKIEKHYPLQPAGIAPTAFITAGAPFWDDYTFKAAVRPAGEGGVGLVFYWRDKDDYFALRWYGDNSIRGGKTNMLELVEVSGGRERVLASKRGGFFADQYYELKVAVRGSGISAFIDGYRILEAKSDGLVCGKFGLWAADGYGAWFDDVKVMSTRSFVEEPPRRRVNPIYSRQADMKQWSDPSRDWKIGYYGKKSMGVYRYRCYGGAEITIEPGARWDSLIVRGFCDDDKSGGVAAVLEGDEFSLSFGEGGIKHEIPALPRDKPLRFRFEKDMFTLFCGDERVLSQPLPAEATTGTRFVVIGPKRFQLGDEPLVKLMELDRTRDYTFERSPVDWFVLDGKWGVMNKWICDPRWSWFGGRNVHGLAAVTTRYAVEGDFSLDLFFATMMMVYVPPYEMLGNYCFTVCDDGADISTGYTFFIGGDMNHWIGVSRGDVILKKNVRSGKFYPFLPADNRTEFLSNDVVHQRWFHVRIERRGNTFTFWFEGKKFYTFTDPRPLPGGHITLWTYRNGMMLSRVRIAARKFVPSPPRFCFERHVNTDGWTDEGARRSRLLVKPDKPRTGLLTATISEIGPCCLVSTLPPFKPSAVPSLALDAALSPGTRADLFFDYNDITYRVRLTGPPLDDPAVPTVGSIPLPDDGDLHRLVIPIAGMLASYLGTTRLKGTVRRIRIGRLTAGGYALAGFGGHGPGGKIVLGPVRPVKPAAECLAGIEPFPGGEALVRFRLKETCPLLDARGLRLLINGRVAAGPRDAVFSPATNSLDVAVPAVLGLKDGDRIDITLEGLRTRSGDPLEPWTLEGFRYDASKDRTPPRLLDDHVFAAPALFLDFEEPFPPNPSPGSEVLSGTFFAGLQRDMTTASWNRSSLKLFCNHIGGVMFYRFTDRKIDLNSTPVISVDYRMERKVPLSFLLGKHEYYLAFNDTGYAPKWSWEPGKRALGVEKGRLGGFGVPICDGRWHNAWFIYDGLRKVGVLQGISVGDIGFRGAYINDQVNFDNLRVCPLIEPPSAEPRLRFSETGGLARVYTSISVKREVPSGRWKPSDGLPKGTRFYFNVAAEDEAGNRSEPVHIPFFCDMQPPVVTQVLWRRNGVVLYMSDVSGIDRASLLLTAGDTVRRGDDADVFWNKYGVSIPLPKELVRRKKAVLTVSDKRGNKAVFRIEKSKAIPQDDDKREDEI